MQQARKSKKDLESPTRGQIECTGHGILLSRAVSSEETEVDRLRVTLISLPVLEGAYSSSHEILEFFLLSELSGGRSTPSTTNRNMLGV